MKQLTCEMCGSTDLMKQDGVFVCQTCGCKYSIEEAKKMMVEGTVKIDNSDKLKNLYQIARRAKDSNDSENAVKYYDKILQEDPNSWEATFYNVYYRAMQTKIAYIASAAESIQNILPDVFGMIKAYVENLSEQKLAIAEIAMHVTAISALLESSARTTFKESYDRALAYSSSTAMEYFHEYGSRNKAIYRLLQVLGGCIEIFDDTDEDLCKLAVEVYKESLQYFANNYLAYDDHDYNKKIMEDSIGSKIRKYEPNYVFPSPNTNGYPNVVIGTINKANRTSNISTTIVSTNSSSANSSSGGCYVATAVYGSYDCPEVWTLRRYRDNQLAETWYGRLFIHTYYAISPTIVKWFGDTEWFKKMWKGKLDNMVKSLQEQGVENTPYNDKKW